MSQDQRVRHRSGGRDVTLDDIKLAIGKAQQQFEDADFIGLKEDLELEGINA